MKKLPTRFAEKVYEVLCKFANADPSHLEKEAFVFHHGVFNDKSPEYFLTCTDDAKRVFKQGVDGEMWVEGSSTSTVNSILRRMTEELKKNEATGTQEKGE